MLQILVTLLLAVSLNEAPLSFDVSPHVQPALGHIIYKIRIETNNDNFSYCYGWYNSTSGESRVSCQQLDGIYAPRFIQKEYNNLGEGEYEAFVELYRVPDHLAARVAQTFTVS